MVIYRGAMLSLRCNLWRSLFVLDRFLAASLGRPTAISEGDCSEVALERPRGGAGPGGTHAEKALDAAVGSGQIIGLILKKVYAHRSVKSKVALDIVKQCGPWVRELDPALHWGQLLDGHVSPARGLAILHANLLYCHAVTLLTRPFFILLVQSNPALSGQTGHSLSARIEKLTVVLSEVCVAASYHTICMIQTAFESCYLPRRNPFVM